MDPDAPAEDVLESLTPMLPPDTGKVRRLVFAAQRGLIGPEVRIGKSVVLLPDALFAGR